MFDINKIAVQCEKSNNKYLCEFVFTQVVMFLHKILLRLLNLKY